MFSAYLKMSFNTPWRHKGILESTDNATPVQTMAASCN